MPPKPHRVLLDRVSGYADEAAAYMRRRRVSRRPFARLYYAERAQQPTTPPTRPPAAELFVAAGRLIEVAGKRAEAVSELIDPAVAERVLARALANGGASPRSSPNGAAASRCRSTSRGSSRSSPAPRRAPGCAWSSGGTTYFAHVDGLDPADLERAADEAAAALRGERARAARRCEAVATHAAADRAAVPRTSRPSARRRCCASSTSAPARQGGEIAQFTASYAEARRQVAVANSEGLLTGDDRTRVRIGAQAVARRGDAVETGAETLGAHRGFELLEDDPARIAEQAARKALTLLDAGPAPAGLDAGRRRRRLRRRPLPRDDRPRARGRPHPEGRQRLRRQARRAGRPAAAQRLRRRPPARTSGAATRSTTRARRPRRRR